MEILGYEAYPYQWNNIMLHPSMFMPQYNFPQNYVHWRETPHSHIYSADLPRVKKEEIRVEVEDSIYLIIRTETADNSAEPAKKFLRKFRFPERIDIEGISAGYENGVLKVTVPWRTFFMNLVNLAGRLDITATAA